MFFSPHNKSQLCDGNILVSTVGLLYTTVMSVSINSHNFHCLKRCYYYTTLKMWKAGHRIQAA